MPTTQVSKDAWMSNALPTTNYGTDVQVYCGRAAGQIYRTILRFPTTGWTGTPSVATLNMWAADYTITATQTIHVVRCTRDNWVEGTKAGSGIADGVTWDSYDSVTAWTTGGGDFDGGIICAYDHPNDATGRNQWHAIDILTLVQDAITNGRANLELIIKLADETTNVGYIRWHTRESTNISYTNVEGGSMVAVPNMTGRLDNRCSGFLA